MATLLVGGNGLIGSRMIKYLCGQGEEVISYSSKPPAEKISGCIYVQGDVTDYGTINMILRKNKVERILHNAAISHPKLFSENPYKIYKTNVTGTMTTLEAARNYGIKRYVYMSSGAVYGNVNMDVVTEEVPLRSENAYGATKVACEELVRNYGLESVSLRIGFVYGPGRQFECPVNMIIKQCLEKDKVEWEHGLDQNLDYIYVDDCVEGIAEISMASELPHTEYNVGGGEIIPYSRIVDKAKEMFPDTIISVGSGTLGYDNLGALSVERAYKDFGWKPRVSIEEGMEKYREWMEKSF